MKILVLTDNEYIYLNFLKMIKEKKRKEEFIFRYSPKNKGLDKKYNIDSFKKISIKKELEKILENFDLVLSLHSKQIFPKRLVETLRCINVHPGLNPNNRGWFPQVFSILNKKPCGATIHLMDEYLDHGDILYQEEIKIFDYETSKDVYDRIINLELELLKKNLGNILNSNYESKPMLKEGNINNFNDYRELCNLNLDEKLTLGEAIDKLRALTHGEYKNGYFVDSEKNKVYVRVELEVADNE